MTDGAAPVWRFAESTPLCAVKYIIYICTIRVGLGRGCDASWVRLAHSAGVVVSLRYCQVGVETWKVSMFDTISQQVVVLGLISRVVGSKDSLSNCLHNQAAIYCILIIVNQSRKYYSSR